MAFFSVLVPVYNVEKYVAECIESVLHQSFTSFELILVDDGSTDNSGIICEEYAAQDNRIKVYHKSNSGLIHTRRYAIERATGDYYVFLDSDDMLKDNALEVINEHISKYNSDCVIYGYEKVQDGKIISATHDTWEICLTDKREIYKIVLFSTEMNSLCRKAVKATVFQDVQYDMYYHIQMSEDLLQSLEIYKNSKSIAFTNEKIYLYRVNSNSITQNHKAKKIDYTVRKKVLEFIEEENAFSEEYKKKYRDFCIKTVSNQLIQICKYHDRASIKEILKLIRYDDYFQLFLKKGITSRHYVSWYRTFIFFLFVKEYDDILISLIKTVFWMRKII